MIGEFISPQDLRWAKVLDQARYDFYHMPGYAELAAEHENGLPLAFYAEEGDSAMLIPLLVRKIPEHLNAPGEWFDASSPYGYPTPLLVGCEDKAVLARFLKTFKAISIDNHIVTVFIRMHPLIEFPYDSLHPFGDLVRHGQTVYIDLSRESELLWSQMRRNHKNNIEELLERGFCGVVDEWSLFGEFIDMYFETMKRVNADPFYFFSVAYFEGLRRVLGEDLHLSVIMSPAGEAVAAGLFSNVNGIVQSHLGASRDKYKHLAPSKLEIYTEMEWSKKNGGLFHHLGGGVGGSSNDALFVFKTGFSETRAHFHTFRMVVDEARYELLSQLWGRLSVADDSTDGAFFPGYRRKCA